MDIQAMKDEHACDLALAELAAAERYLNALTMQVRNLRSQARRGRTSYKLAMKVVDLADVLRASVNTSGDLLSEIGSARVPFAEKSDLVGLLKMMEMDQIRNTHSVMNLRKDSEGVPNRVKLGSDTKSDEDSTPSCSGCTCHTTKEEPTTEEAAANGGCGGLDGKEVS